MTTAKRMLYNDLMKKIIFILILFAMYARCNDEKSIHDYANWKSDPSPYSIGPYHCRNHGGYYMVPYYYSPSSEVNPSTLCFGLSFSYSSCGNDCPACNFWWNKYLVHLNTALKTSNNSNITPIAGSALLILNKKVLKSPLRKIMDKFLSTTNRTKEIDLKKERE